MERKIEKDAEWNRLEGHVEQLHGDLHVAEQKLRDHAESVVERQLGLVRGVTVLAYQGGKYVFTRAKGESYGPWVYGTKIRKDGTPSERETCLYSDWEKY